MSSSQPEGTLPFPVSVREPGVQDENCDGLDATDEQLLQRVRADDSLGLRLLFQRYSRLTLRICLRILHDYGEAEETVQDIFLYVHQRAKTFDETKGTAKGWIVQLAYHRAFDRLKFLKRRGFYLGTDISSAVEILNEDTNLEQKLDSELNRRRLEKAFQELPEQQRKTLELFYFEGLDLREISEQMNESLGNVRHWYYRGLKKLRMSSIVKKLRDE